MERNRDVVISKTLAYLLRHGAQKEGIPIEADGFVEVEHLLQNKQLQAKHTKFTDIKRVVAENNKQRFTLAQSDDGKWKIKANQGHSLAEINELNLKKLETIDHPVVHGTYLRFWHHDIKKEGLKKMKRNHIHFACTDNIDYGGKTIVSGFRKDAEVLIYIDTSLALKDGIEFFRSENKVILSSGNDGIMPPKYFQKVIERKTGQNLLVPAK